MDNEIELENSEEFGVDSYGIASDDELNNDDNSEPELLKPT
jgi:hypothetical protein